MLSEHATLVIRDKITTTDNLSAPTSLHILSRGGLSERHALLNYRAFTYSACKDSKGYARSYLQHNSYSHF
jgi:hypothetical protein